ncbi:Phosphomethylpyrimidine kinase, Thiamine-phosphate diphosphorylase [Shewanella sediminis HAW-EB3]|uniref:Thiamine-phosphate synthase n=1 Tax=Shewanella sediminis (strain HAW-EB3) TaxID=425104 RepID=A8FUV0_SHESH|nr:thiamine phosphate synthase [Shewanella sediminis]ABV36623.1 Phosphomethylpyrimidine kinase, Thiamine-phosphate diphosphorylase [Shewanella sediminis HAW-EB3]
MTNLELTSSALKPVVWTIAGSDSGGGAGIQADLATIQDLGCHACSAITCLTAQNSVSVTLVEPVSEAMLLAQLDVLLTDLPPMAIKIGLLASQAQLNLLGKWLNTSLREFTQTNAMDVSVILDPVMVASCGAHFTAQSRAESNTKKLDNDSGPGLDSDSANGSGGSVRDGTISHLNFLPLKGLITLITPNTAELSVLSGRRLTDLSDCHRAAKALSKTFECNVLAKGGDKGAAWEAKTAQDIFVCVQAPGSAVIHQQRSFLLSSPRVDSTNNHGSGCTLSSAIASVMAWGFVLQDAVVVAKAYVTEGIKQSYRVGKGPGPLARTGWSDELSGFAHITSLDGGAALPDELTFKVLDDRLGVYPVVTELSMLQALLGAGAKTIQLRIKDADDPELEAKIITAIQLGRDYRAKVFINDYWQLAVKHQAFGVHLGQEDLYDADLTQIAQSGLALGVSSHSYFELLLASQFKPSYIALGHIFPTTTKVMPSLPQGLHKLKHYVDLLKGHFPLVAIGGIDLNRLPAVKKTNVDDIAVVRAVTEADEPAVAYQTLVAAWSIEDE